MARSGFSSSNYLANVGTGQAWPFFLSIWAKIGNAVDFEAPFATAAGSGVRIDRLLFNDSEQILFQAIGTGSQTITSSAVAQNTWHHIAVYADQADRELWVNGTSIGSGTTDIGATTFARTSLGIVAYDATPFTIYPMTTGTVGECAVWSVSARLSAGEITALSKGASPGTIRPGSLRHWWECIGTGGAADRMGACNLTETGTVTEVESRLTSRGGAIVVPFSAAAPGGGFQAAWARNANTVIQAVA